MVERGGERGLMPEVAREHDHHHARVASRGGLEQRQRVVAAAVVHEQELVRPARRRIEHGQHALEERRDHLGFVVDRHGDRHAAGAHLATPWK